MRVSANQTCDERNSHLVEGQEEGDRRNFSG
jgi:hypothetical protein